MKLLIGIVALLFLILAGCSVQTITKYQCADGSFVDSANLCPKVTCKPNYPQLDCANCPSKIEYQTKEVEKNIYVDKLKIECLDGVVKDKKEDCTNIQDIIKSIPKKDSVDICSDPANKYLEKIELTTAADRRKQGNDILETKVKWYPSLNEGWVEMYFLRIKNAGCTIIEREKISFTITMYDGAKIIYSEKRKDEGFSYFYSGDTDLMGNRKIYPNDEDTISTPFNIKTTGGLMGWEYFKFNKVGNYPVKFDIYYNDKLIAHAEDVIIIS